MNFTGNWTKNTSILTNSMIGGKKPFNVLAKHVRNLEPTYILSDLIFEILIPPALLIQLNLYIAFIKD